MSCHRLMCSSCTVPQNLDVYDVSYECNMSTMHFDVFSARTKDARIKESEERSEHQETIEEDSELKPPDEVFSYEQLKAKSENPATGIDTKRREVCI